MSASHSGDESSPLRRLVRLFRPDRGDFIAVAVFAMAMGVLLLATPIAVQALVNSVALGGAIPPLVVVSLLLLLGLSLAGMLSAVQTWIVEILQRRLFARTVAELAARLPRISIAVYDKSYGPELVNRFFDIITIQKTVAGLLLNGLSLLLSVLVGLVVLAFYHPLLLAFDILLLAVIALIVFAPLRRGVRSAIAESEAKYAVAGWLEEITRQPYLFRSSGMQPWVFEKSDRVVRNYLDTRAQHYRVLFGQIVSAIGLHVLASTALLGIGGFLVIQGSLTLGQLVAAELIVTLIVSSVAKMGKHLESYYDLIAATVKVTHLLDLPLEPMGGEERLSVAERNGIELELCELASAPVGGPPLFEDLSLHLAPGETLAITGPSGAGKSVLLEWLWGLRRPERGRIRFDGRDLRDLSLDSVRESVSFAAEVEILDGSLRQNVRVGRDGVSEDDVRNALASVGILHELEQLEHGLDTKLAALGRPLAGSTLRCLQIARAIAGRPRLLIVSDRLLQFSGARRAQLIQALFHPNRSWTLIVVSESEDITSRCDKILLLPEGITTARAHPTQPQLAEER